MKIKNVCFRVDSSNLIGGGHILRCLAFANYLKKKKINSYFLIRKFDGNFSSEIKKNNHKVYFLKKLNEKKIFLNTKKFTYKYSLQTKEKNDAKETLNILNKILPDIVIVDHYGISKIWHNEIKKKYKLMVIDDLADRKYNCDILVDPTYGRKKIEYRKLVNKNCKLLLGSNKALINENFTKIKIKTIKKNLNCSEVKKIIITMGNSDLLNTSYFAVRCLLNSSFKRLTYLLILGKNYNFKNKINSLLNKSENLKIINFTNNFAKYAANSDFAITTPSVTLSEFATIGLPSAVIINSKNQKDVAKNLETKRAIINLGQRKKLNKSRFLKKIGNIINNFEKRKKMIKTFHKICDGNGKLIVYKNILDLF